MTARIDTRAPARVARARLRGQVWPLLQTAAAAVVAWYVARLTLPDAQPSFAAIAAVIAVGASYAERPRRAIELMLGVVVGLSAADLLVHAIGSGPLQVGATVTVAMVTALLLGGGPLFVSEAGVSAILMTALPSASAPIFPTRPIEAAVGAAVALAVSSLAFPPDPRLHVARAADGLLSRFAWMLDDVAAALEQGDRARGDGALQAARGLDAEVQGLEESLEVAADTMRLAPLRRSARADVDRYRAATPHLDYAVRNGRVLARHAARAVRAGAPGAGEVADAVRAVRAAVWDLASELETPDRASELRAHAARATHLATAAYERNPHLGLAELVVQVRSVVIDVVRASDAGGRGAAGAFGVEAPTDELLVALPAVE